MPELPEVETIRRGIAPHITGKQVQQLIVRQPRLRWPVPAQLAQTLPGQFIHGVRRRGKYLLLCADQGAVIIHLGMSGSLRLMSKWKSPERHDHVDLVFTDNVCLRLRDPRRFGALLRTERS